MIRLWGLLILAMVFKAASAQCVSPVNSFQAGEKLNYRLLYTWGFIWIHAADLQFSVVSQKTGVVPAYLLSANASSVKTFDWFFKVRDSFRSLVTTEKFYTCVVRTKYIRRWLGCASNLYIRSIGQKDIP
ncbi:MAG: DUF3108 domain-containing protein [Bacteroidales bacterium]|nr:DUF3108 domain-containing protein [Bacteroidales bacterium]